VIANSYGSIGLQQLMAIIGQQPLALIMTALIVVMQVI